MIRDLSQIAATGAKTMGLLIAAYGICHLFILIDFLSGQ